MRLGVAVTRLIRLGAAVTRLIRLGVAKVGADAARRVNKLNFYL
jgi:hypothetical protein